jgi:hypothetical protein
MVSAIKKVMTNWQEIPLLVLAVAIFFVAQWVLPILDPTSGFFDGGYLHKPVAAAVWLLVGHALAWTMFTISWRTLNKYVDSGEFARCFNDHLHSPTKIFIVIGVYVFPMLAYLFCLWCVPL